MNRSSSEPGLGIFSHLHGRVAAPEEIPQRPHPYPGPNLEMETMTGVQALCVYCGSSDAVAPAHLELARQVGREAAQRDIAIVYGGGRVGLMGALAESATEAGGRVIGIIPGFLEKLEVGNRATSEYHVVESMHSRKNLMFERSDAFCVLPGGLGTLDETFEMITWRLLKLHDKPIVLVNPDGYWDPLLALIDHQTSAGYLRVPPDKLFDLVPDVESLFDLLARAPAPKIEADREKF